MLGLSAICHAHEKSLESLKLKKYRDTCLAVFSKFVDMSHLNHSGYMLRDGNYK